MLYKIANWIVDHRRIIVILMLILTVVCGILMPFVGINYDMTKYLPDDSSMKIGIDLMAEDFPDMTEESNIRVMFQDLDASRIPRIRKELAEIEYVKNVDYESGNPKYNKDNHTLFVVYTDYAYNSKEELSIEEAIEERFGDMDMVWKTSNVGEGELPASTVVLAMSLLLAILFAMCRSWFEPVVFAVAIGLAVIINLGTNIFQGEISQMTFTIAALLQMVLSMDYSIILMNRYRQELERTADREQAMKNALTLAFPSIFSSGMTTIVGLLMLVFMSFKIGMDMGVVLAKGVFLSMISVCTVLPALILRTTDLIFRLTKKEFDPNMNGVANFAARYHRPMALLFAVLLLGSYYMQSRAEMSYTLVQDDPIRDQFPIENQIVLLYSNEDEAAVAELAGRIQNGDKIDSVMCYSTTLGRQNTVTELAEMMTQMDSDAKLDPSILKLIYYDRFAGGTAVPMTADELFRFLDDTIANDPQFSGYLDEDMRSQLSSMQIFESRESLTRPRSASELASLFGLDTASVEQLMQYYAIKHPTSSSMTMTLPAFVNFLTQDVASDPEYGSMIPADAAAQLESFRSLTDRENLSRDVSPSEGAEILGIDDSRAEMMWVLYALLQGEGADRTYDSAEFIRFMAGQLDSNPLFSEQMDADQAGQIRFLSGILSAAGTGNTLTAGALGQILSLGEQVTNSFLTAANGSEMTVNDAIDLLLANPDWGLTEEEIAQYAQIRDLVKSAAYGTKYDPDGMAELLGMDSGTIRFLYAYKSLSDSGMDNYKVSLADLTSVLSSRSGELTGLMGEDEIAQIRTMAELVQGTLSGKGYTASELASVTGMDPDEISMLYLLHVMKHGGSIPVSCSIQEFLDFLADDVLTNDQFSSYIDASQASQLQGARALADAVVSGTELSPDGMAALLSGLGSGMDTGMLDLLYLYHSALYHSDPSWTMSVVELFDHVETNMLADPRFSAFMDDAMKEDLQKSKKQIEDGISQLRGPRYSILMISSTLEAESEETEAWYRNLQQQLKENLTGDYHLIGTTPMNYEMKDSFHREILRITLLTALSIFLVVLLTFRNFLIPLILVLLVQCGVWINVAASVMFRYDIYYMAQLIVQCILMGATIDYGILFTNYYREYRQTSGIREALQRSYKGATHTILTSGLIIILVTGVVGISPSVEATIRQICRTISLGSLAATLLILFVLPGLLAAFDRIVTKGVDAKQES